MPDMREQDERRDRVHVLTLAGLAAWQIAERVGCSERQVKRDRKTLGLSKPAPRRLTDEDLDRAMELLADGCSRTEVARTLGCNEKTIRNRFPGFAWPRHRAAAYVRTLREGRNR